MTFSEEYSQQTRIIFNTSHHFSTQMDQSDIEQLTAIFAKLGYDISITKRKTNEADEKKEETKEPIIPQKAKTDEKKWKCIPYHNNDFKCVPIYMPTPVNDKKCLCRLEKKGIPTQCTGIRLKGEKICTRHNKKMSGWGFYDDDEPPERTSDGKLISWNFATKKVAVEKKDEPEKESGTTIITAVKTKKDVPLSLDSMSDEEEDKQIPVKKMTNSKHDELMKSLEESTDEEDVSSSEDDDEYNIYKKKDDLKLEDKTIDGVTYSYYLETNRLTNLKNEFVGIWNGRCIAFDSHQRKTDHQYHPDYKPETLIVGQ